jgi:hypothetical protein
MRVDRWQTRVLGVLGQHTPAVDALHGILLRKTDAHEAIVRVALIQLVHSGWVDRHRSHGRRILPHLCKYLPVRRVVGITSDASDVMRHTYLVVGEVSLADEVVLPDRVHIVHIRAAKASGRPLAALRATVQVLGANLVEYCLWNGINDLFLALQVEGLGRRIARELSCAAVRWDTHLQTQPLLLHTALLGLPLLPVQ